ncbi:nicotinate mononucleotide-dependent phosphoribosyltransferase CobT [Methanoregula sp.]|uniref:nicotinate mononucleotide-dependent phosphoribosyltransferase CobT n=1 Tax=Methanoregula sp. TaxID=2052170 RepID=UPI002C51A4A7|nr:TIGR00303 family protein [Methanoregula sp.]HVP96671.1 TIGR00303 family protein [Methanoregula sp.]
MPFLTGVPGHSGKKISFCVILGNTLVSTIPGISGAGPSPEKTLLTPNLDAELVTTGRIANPDFKPNTPTGCPTPATITRAMVELTGVHPLFINAGLRYPLTVPYLDAMGCVGNDPRNGDAVPLAQQLFSHGEEIGKILSGMGDMLILGECVPGGTTTALCVLRALGYPAAVSSSFVNNPLDRKEAICQEVLASLSPTIREDPMAVIRHVGDPMIPVAAGIARTYSGTLVLAGGTQMLAVCGVIKAMEGCMPEVATTVYVRDDPSANVEELAAMIGVPVYYVDPGFGEIGHDGLARYCSGEVKEGTGAGGAMFMASVMGFTPDQIRKKIFEMVNAYC